MHIHLTILVSFLTSLITSFSLTDPASFPYSAMLCTHAEYKLPFALREKPLLAKKEMKNVFIHKGCAFPGTILEHYFGWQSPTISYNLPSSLGTGEAVNPPW